MNRNEKDFSTVFYFSVLVAITCYFILFFSAPYIAGFYEQPELIDLTRVLGLNFLINVFAMIPRVKSTIALDFKILAKVNFIAAIFSGSFALILTYLNAGVWAIVSLHLSASIVSVILINMLKPWLPKEKFCIVSFREMFDFGSKLLVSGLINTLYKNIYGIVIGKYYSADTLGQFNQANSLSKLPAMTMSEIIKKVTFPLLSGIQKEEQRLEQAYLLILQFTALICFPVMFGLCIVAEPLIYTLLGIEWLITAKYISIITLAVMLYPIESININILQVKGRTDIILKLEVINKTISTLILVCVLPLGIEAMCFGMLLQSFTSLFFTLYYVGKVSMLSLFKQFNTLSVIYFISAISAFLGYILGDLLSPNDFITIIVTLVISLMFYLLLMLTVKRQVMYELISFIKRPLAG